ncbi:MAG: PAS domain S-box protein [Prolixibacteraceae bacterium]
MKKPYFKIIKLLDKFSSSFSKIGTLDQMAQAVEEILEETYGVEYTGLYLYDPLEKRLRLLQAKGFSEEELVAAEMSALLRHPGMVFNTGRMLYIPDILLDKDELSKSSERSFEVRSRLYLPVKNGEEVVGAFGIVDSKPNAYNEDDIAILSFICNLSGALYANILNQNELKKMALIARETANSTVITNSAGEIEWANTAFTKLTGYKLEEVKGKKPGSFLQGDATDKNTISFMSEAFKERKPFEVDIVNYSKSNRKYWLNLQVQPVFDAFGNLECFIAMQKEITREKEIEEELKKREIRYSKLVSNINDVIVIIDKEGNNSYKSPNSEKLFGWKPEELVGKSAIGNIHPDDLEDALKILGELGESNIPKSLEFRYRCKDGHYTWVEYTASNLMYDPDIQGFLGSYHDISIRKEAEEKLRESEARFNKIFNSSPALMYLLNVSDRRISAVNDTMVQKTGMSRDEMIGQLVTDIPMLFLTDNPPEILQELKKYQRIEGMEIQFTTASGEILNGSLSREIIESFDQEYFLVLITDITDIKNTESKLKASEERINKLSEHNRVYTWEVDNNGLYTYVSDSCDAVLGYAQEELVGKKYFYELHPENDRDEFKAGAFAVFALKEPFRNLENSAVTKDGQIVWMSTNGIPILDGQGNMIGYSGTDTDITERKLAEEALNQSEKRIQAITDSEHDAILMMDNEGLISFWNPAAERIFGYKKDEAIGKSLHLLLVPLRYHEAHHKAFPIFKETGEGSAVGKTLDLEAIRKDGKEISIQMSLSAIFTDGAWHSVGILRDISERKRSEEELNKLFRAVEQSPVITYVTNLSGEIEYANPKVFEITGYSKEEIIGNNPRIFSSGEHSSEDYTNLWKTINSGKEWKGEFHNKKKNGQLYWVSASLSPVFDIHEKMSHFIAVEEDITQQKEDLEALQIANLRFRSLISSMQSAVMVEDEERRIVVVNQYFCDLFSIPLHPDQLIGAECANAAEESKYLFTNPEMFVQDINNTLKLHQVVTDFELNMVSGRSLERDFIPLDDAGNKNHGILWIYRDITERKRTESNLLRQSQILSGTAQAMNYLLTIHDHDQAVQKALETIGLATRVDRVYIFENNVDAKTGEAFFSQQFEWTAKGIVPQIGNQELQNMPYSQNFPNWFNTLRSGKTVSGLTESFPEHERCILEDEDIKSILAAPIFVNEQLWGMVGFDDCTIGINWSTNEISIITALAGSLGGSISKRIVENELIEARHIAEYATKTKSDFLATMSHEIRTPMNGVIGMTSLLMQTPLTSDQRDYAETIRVSGELLLDVINDILDFSKIESGKMILEEHHFDLRLAIEDVLDLMTTSTYEKKLGLYFRVDPAIPKRITGDLTRLRQILVNLVGNAVKFTLKGEIIINVNQLEISGDISTLEFSIRDTGVGIPEEKIGLLFKPFSQVDASTTRKFGGTGLGLAICAKLIGLMKGKIWVKSEVGFGTEFIFTIQTQYHIEKETSNIPSFENLILKGKKVLIVDSNETSGKILYELLGSNDFVPYLADSREKALSVLESNNDINLALIDDELPMGSGVLAYGIRKLIAYNELPLILVIQPVLSESSVATDPVFQAKINKPLKHSQLISSIRNLLSKSIASKSPGLIQPVAVHKINDQYPFKILVAEDNAINQKLISRLFEMLGYSIHIAANGFEVLDALKRMKIDIVFMDIQMPEMDGIEATHQIVAQWGDKKPLIVAMTANALYSDKEKCIAAGMDDYISKPLTITQVRNGIQKWAHLIKTNDQIIEQ